MASIPAEEIKRQILMASDRTKLKENTLKRMGREGGPTQDDVIEIGQELERVCKLKGWSFIEAYMLRRMNLVGMLYEEDKDGSQKGIARGYVDLMQYIDQMIKAKDEILMRDQSGDDNG
jgi:hypothetical protein